MRTQAVRAFALGIITGSFFTAGAVLLSAPAKADPISPALVQDAVNAEPYVCQALSDSPTVPTVVSILETVSAADRLSASDTGTVVALAVYDGCAKFVPVLDRFVALYATAPAAGSLT